jgi:DNA-binding response OmpR family regulator
MTSVSILLIESRRANAPSFAPALEKKGYDVISHHTIHEALVAAQRSMPDLIVLDAASMKTSGSRMSRATRQTLNGVPIILVAPDGAEPDPGNGADLTLFQPFTARKLLNRVARFLPGDDHFSIEAGPIKLNAAQRTVRCHAKESRLTPKQAKLLEVFLQHPGRLLTRESLIRQVWHTDYIGDTRTLDVHMSWLRKAIEPDPTQPVLFKTIRGIGYRLDLPA